MQYLILPLLYAQTGWPHSGSSIFHIWAYSLNCQTIPRTQRQHHLLHMWCRRAQAKSVKAFATFDKTKDLTTSVERNNYQVLLNRFSFFTPWREVRGQGRRSAATLQHLNSVADNTGPSIWLQSANYQTRKVCELSDQFTYFNTELHPNIECNLIFGGWFSFLSS